MINDLLRRAVKEKASDLHLTVNYKPALRVDTQIKILDDLSEISSTAMKKMVEDILSLEQKKTFYNYKDLDLSLDISNLGRFRVNLYWERGNIALVARIISKNIPSLEEVGLNSVAKNLITKNQGLVLVTGPTGSGKSTTLAAMINYINQTRNVSIVTLEDPIEYLFPKSQGIITQRELGSDMKTFASGLKHVLRQDPDIIMVGEMRDLESIALTLTLAETGHLVLATLHTPNALQVIDRIVDVFPAHQQDQIRMQFSIVLNAVLAQRILPRTGGGLVAAREILINTPAVSNIIREKKTPQINTVMQTSADKGMVTMKQAIKELYEQNLIDEKIAQTFLVDDVKVAT